MLDRMLIQAARANLRKQAFVPLTPEAQAAAAAGGGMPPGGMPPGAPPMPVVPAMMGGGMPPGMPPGLPPMDPAMMGGGMPPGAPPMPMDPAMMGGAMPPGMPMDPAMMGMPPAPAPGGEPVMVSMDDLRSLVEEVVGKTGEAETKRVTNAQIMDKLEEIETTLSAVFGPLSASEVGATEEPAAGTAQMPAGMPPDVLSMLQSTPGPGMAGPGMPGPGMPVQASRRRAGRLVGLIAALKDRRNA